MPPKAFHKQVAMPVPGDSGLDDIGGVFPGKGTEAGCVSTRSDDRYLAGITRMFSKNDVLWAKRD